MSRTLRSPCGVSTEGESRGPSGPKGTPLRSRAPRRSVPLDPRSEPLGTALGLLLSPEQRHDEGGGSSGMGERLAPGPWTPYRAGFRQHLALVVALASSTDVGRWQRAHPSGSTGEGWRLAVVAQPDPAPSRPPSRHRAHPEPGQQPARGPPEGQPAQPQTHELHPSSPRTPPPLHEPLSLIHI